MSSSATEQFNATAVVARAASLSHYARHLLAADPALAEAPWDQPFPAAHMNASLAGIDETDEAGLDRTLRKLRQAVMLRLIVRDLAGLADLQEVVDRGHKPGRSRRWARPCAGMTAIFPGDYGRPLGTQSGKPLQLHVIGMGKLGGGELNVSSDIDLIFAYPEEGETDGAAAHLRTRNTSPGWRAS